MDSKEKIKLVAPTDAAKAWRRAALPYSQSLHGNKRGERLSGCAHHGGEGPCCRRHAVVLPGYGKRDYPFPTPEQLLQQFIASATEKIHAHKKPAGGAPAEGEFLGMDEHDHEHDEDSEASPPSEKPSIRQVFGLRNRPLQSRGGHHHSVRSPAEHNDVRGKSSTPAKTDGKGGDTAAGSGDGKASGGTTGGDVTVVPATKAVGPVLRIAAGTLAHIMHEGRDKAVIARKFDPLRGAVHWALTEMPAKYRPQKYRDTAASLKDQLGKLVDVYRATLPRAAQFLGAQFPNASEEELLEAAVEILNEQLAEILMVLSIWTDSFAQRRDGMYTQLEYVHFTVEQALRLFQTGDAAAREEKGIKTHAFHVGDVFMARFSDQGPATIPGGRGPVGAHAIEVPFDEQDVIVLYTPLYTHEFRHDYYNDVDGLAESMTEAVVNSIKTAHAAGKIKLTADHYMLGKQKVPAISLITQVMAQTLPETDADVAGGVSLTGEAYGWSMVGTFCAFNIRGQNPVAVNRMLRHSSVYAVGEQGELAIEPHLPDYIRVYAVAAALEAMGFGEQAQEFRNLADQAAGIPKPTHIIWRNLDPSSKFKFEIKIPVEDLKAVLPFVVDAILNAPLPALNGLSTSQMVNWTPKRQAKVDALVANLMKGSSQIPWEMGDFWATYIAAAVTKAAWKMWMAAEVPPMHATAIVEEAGRAMMDQVKERFERLEAEAEAAKPTVAAPPAGTPTPEPASESDVTGGDADDVEEGEDGADGVGVSEADSTGPASGGTGGKTS